MTGGESLDDRDAALYEDVGGLPAEGAHSRGEPARPREGGTRNIPHKHTVKLGREVSHSSSRPVCLHRNYLIVCLHPNSRRRLNQLHLNPV